MVTSLLYLVPVSEQRAVCGLVKSVSMTPREKGTYTEQNTTDFVFVFLLL